jgi:hypothetical protein
MQKYELKSSVSEPQNEIRIVQKYSFFIEILNILYRVSMAGVFLLTFCRQKILYPSTWYDPPLPLPLLQPS